MATENKLLWKSTIVVALITSVIYFYSGSFFRGSWAFGEFPVTLWCVWLGILGSTKIRIPIWLRAVLICSCVGLYFFFPHFNIQITGITYMLKGLGALKYVVLFLFGLGISPKLKQNDKFWEDLILFIVFLSLYIFVMLVEQRSSYTLYALEAEPVGILLKVARYGKAIPLAAAIWFCIKLVLSDKIQKVFSKKGMSITALVIILVLSILDLIRSVVSYGQFQISVILTNPAISIMIILCIEKLAERLCSQKCNI